MKTRYNKAAKELLKEYDREPKGSAVDSIMDHTGIALGILSIVSFIAWGIINLRA